MYLQTLHSIPGTLDWRRGM